MKIKAIFASVFIIMGISHAKTDWIAPQASSNYDWKYTHWFGINGGTITGMGLSYQYWGESRGLKFTLLPVYSSESHNERLYSIGAAGLFSINTPAPAPAGFFGFTNNHYYWFVAAARGEFSIINDKSNVTTASVGLGVDLNRRDSRFGIMLGVGPYLYTTSEDKLGLNIYPTLELSWHFGAPRRTNP